MVGAGGTALPNVYVVNISRNANAVNMGQNEGVPTAKTTRTRYHHGDLGNALTVAATDLARAGGPEAVVLREAARMVGVSATAAYRHFANHAELIHAVKGCSQADLAAAMRTELAALPADDDPRAAAIARLRAIGRGYLHFALTQPGLFRTAFCHAGDPSDPVGAATDGSESYRMLGQTLDDLVAAGVLDPARRLLAEVAAWAAVHGLAMLLLDGPFSGLPAEMHEAAITRTLDLVTDGLSR